jgi:hypothetical protein
LLNQSRTHFGTSLRGYLGSCLVSRSRRLGVRTGTGIIAHVEHYSKQCNDTEQQPALPAHLTLVAGLGLRKGMGQFVYCLMHLHKLFFRGLHD